MKLLQKIYAFIRELKQTRQTIKEFKKNNVINLPSNTFIKCNETKDLYKKVFIFRDLEKDEYNLIIKHKNEDLYKTRKLAWATFELSGAARSLHVAQKLNLILGYHGIFSYIGGGRFNNGLYNSYSSINIYRKSKFLIVKIITTYKNDLEFDEIGLIGKKHQLLLESPDKQGNINDKKLIKKIELTLANDTYIIYANISPNIADGSSIWMSSVTEILATNHKVILLLKENLRSNIIISNIINKDNVIFLEPKDYTNLDLLDEKQALDIIRQIDDIHPKLRGVFVRGIVAANELVSDRRFKYRSISYLTDFYEVKDDAVFISDEKEKMVKNIALHTKLLLIQTKEIRDKLFSIIGYTHTNYAYLPPSLPDGMFNTKKERSQHKNNEIHIGYAGKIMPNWGVEELLSWVIDFNKYSTKKKIKLFIAANKISAPGSERKPFVSKIINLIKESGAEHYTNYNREQCIEMLNKVDFVWAYRPAKFEDNTLELSTKLLEAIAMQQKVICYPSNIHCNELGFEYPFYIKNQNDFEKLMMNSNYIKFDLSTIANKLQEKHAISNVANRLASIQPLNILANHQKKPTICFAGHDFKFIDAYISYLKSLGNHIIRDNWEWGKAVNLERTKYSYEKADIIFCEWGLANAVWYSKNNIKNKPIYIRVHLQEINERAKKFGKMIDFSQIKKIIFVSERVRDEYINLFHIPKEKTVIISNFVLDDEYSLSKNKKEHKCVNLGMVGIIPQRKRFDRAVQLLLNLLEKGIDAKLHIKGHRPENLDFMKGPSRIKELDYYNEIYQLIKDKQIEDRVIFSGWGNDVALWYQNIDFILSPSDFESFHYALADGILAGCIPVIWNWGEAEILYKSKWIVESDENACQYVLDHINTDNKKILQANRQFIIDRYGKISIFKELDNTIQEENYEKYFNN